MAKRTPTPAPVPDLVNESLLALAETLLSSFFFDPENEDFYKRGLSQNRPSGANGIVLHQESIELPSGDCALQIEALRGFTRFRIRATHPAFSAVIEGTWSFSGEELKQTKFTHTGDAGLIEDSVEALLDIIDERDLDGDEVSDLLSAIDDDEDEAPLIGDDPTEPPAATSLDRSRLKAIAKRVARNQHRIDAEDRSWLEQTPQILPVVTESLISAANAAKPDEAIIDAYHDLLGMTLEFVRYRQDRGWDWADDMLQAFQQQLIGLARDEAVPQEDWFRMCSALSEARVPIGDDIQTMLADAGFKPDAIDTPPDEMLKMVRHLMDELAQMVTTPYEVVEALKSSSAVLPSTLRSFMTTELALSAHPILREAVPLLLLDDDTTVRKAAAGALEQIAHPDTLSSSALRRAITIRNWIPSGDRAPLDSAIRKARLAGVEIGAWPEPMASLEFFASVIDGSGAQSLLAVSRTAKKGLFSGVLLRHGAGVVDAWADASATRGQIGKLLREAQMQAQSAPVNKSFVDRAIQHAIGASVQFDGVPPPSLLEIAELVGGSEWKDRQIDVPAETESLFQSLAPVDHTPDGIAAGMVRAGEWMSNEDVFGSWFEDGPQVHKALAKLPRTDKSGMLAVVMNDILPPERSKWTEWFLLLALWYRAASDAKLRSRARDAVIVAHALAGEQRLDSIPAMGIIAQQTIRAVLLGGW
jgi:hypothetical protein